MAWQKSIHSGRKRNWQWWRMWACWCSPPHALNSFPAQSHCLLICSLIQIRPCRCRPAPQAQPPQGWAGRVADALAAMNAGKSFPPSVSLSGPALFSKGNIVQAASLIPGFDMQMYGFNLWPATPGQARQQALQEILSFNSGLTMIQAADKVRQDALGLSAMLKSLVHPHQ